MPVLIKGAILILGFLTFATVIVWSVRFKEVTELKKRIKAWWLMAGIFLFAVLLKNTNLTLVVFCVLSLLAMKEYLKISNIPGQHNPVIPWSFFIIIIQYYWIVIDWYGMFVIFIPIYAFLFISIRLILTKNPCGFLNSSAKIQWGLLAFGLGLSHTAYLAKLPSVNNTALDGRCLLLFLVIITELNDVSQYIWGKSMGKKKILPQISPKKTWEGFFGGVITSIAIGMIIRFLTPFSLIETIFISLTIAVSGFFGDLAMSALKRDKGIKDFSKAIPGHGGVLDRLDSICYSAPVFFHIVRYFYY